MDIVFKIATPKVAEFKNHRILAINAVKNGYVIKQMAIYPKTPKGFDFCPDETNVSLNWDTLNSWLFFKPHEILWNLGQWNEKMCYAEAFECGELINLTDSEIRKLKSSLEKDKFIEIEINNFEKYY